MVGAMVTGHRPARLLDPPVYDMSDHVYDDLRQEMRVVLESLRRRYGDDLVAVSGMALGIDTLWAQIALDMGIPLHAYIPCVGQDAPWKPESRRLYADLLARASWIEQCSDKPYSHGLMNLRNQRMVDDSVVCLAVWNGKPGGTGDAVARFRRKEGSLLIWYHWPDGLLTFEHSGLQLIIP
jgi:uncharacterized phage-like protein YoqJ